MLRPPSRRLALLLFFVPWLIIALTPLRAILRVHALGSEFDTRGMGVTPLTMWLSPLPQTQNQLKPKSSQLWPDIQLKAPLNRGEASLTAGDLLKASDDGLKQQPNSAFWQAMRLQVLLTAVPSQRLLRDDKGFNISHSNNRWNDPWELAVGWYYGQTQTFSTIGRSEYSTGYGDEGFVLVAHRDFWKPKIDPLTQALRAARRGAALEPDNAYWPYQESYLLLLQNRDALAWKALQRAAQLPRYDSHGRGEVRAALRVAELHRPLFVDEKLCLLQQQIHKDAAWPTREKLWLLQSLRAETKGDAGRALAIAHALSRIAARMQKGALAPLQMRCAIVLQCAAWRGWKRQPRQVIAKQTYVATLQELKCLNYYGAAPPKGLEATPLLFAQQFARAARRAGHADWAGEALQMGRDATRFDGGAFNDYQGDDRYVKWRMLDSLVPFTAFDTTAALLLIQGQLVLAAWLILNVLLWRRLWFFGRWGLRIGNVVAMAWRVRDKPLWDEDVTLLDYSPKDMRRAFWIIGALSIIGTGGFAYHSLMFSSGFEEFRNNQPYNEVLMGASLFLFILAPLVCGALWCGGVTLHRYLHLKVPRVWRDDVETSALRAPPSLFPRAAAFATWSLTGLALACWMGVLLANIFPPTAFSFVAPPLWTRLFDIRTIGLFTRWPEWLAAACAATVMALCAWVAKWLWQLHARRRLPALFMAARWLSHLLGAGLVVVSWFYLVLLCLSLPARQQANARFEQVIAPVKTSAPLRSEIRHPK